ncbi:MAG TPA: ABC transporter substrate-binding protein [Micromonosporaceae bacterium]|nr:ABC transporter substrate-binding protein [Micromonosporaceae bacterium]
MTPEVPLHATRRQVLVGTALVGGSLATAACSPNKPAEKTNSERQQTLFVAGWQWGPPPHFNPLNPTAGFPTQQNQWQLIYESLFGFHMVTGKLEPQLGASLDMPDGKTIVVKLQPDAKWHDGKPVTADDVVFTYELAKRHTGVPYSAAWEYLDSVTKTDDKTVTFALKAGRVNPGMTKTNLAQVYILPAHVWTAIEAQNPKILEYKNDKPVGSGPYTLGDANAQQVVYNRFEDYWGKGVRGGLPAPKKIVHPIFKDNAAGNLAFERGEIDVMQQFTPQIWKMWEEKKQPVSTWFAEAPYFLPGGMPMLVMNTTKPGLNNPKVRRALAHAIDYARIAEQAMSRYSEPAKSSLILPKGSDQQYFDASNVEQNGWKTDLAKSAQILEQELGAKKGGDGVYVLGDGTRLGPWTLQTPSGWSDWQTAVQIVAENAKAAGFDITPNFPEANQLTPNVQSANFDLAVWYIGAQTTAATPWQRYRDVMDIRGIPAPGQAGFYNYGRFNDNRVAPLLDQAATATGDDLKGLLKQLDTIFMQNAPMIPLMYRPLDFFEVNETVWTGFPSEKNPKSPPTFSGAGYLWLYDIKPK